MIGYILRRLLLSIPLLIGITLVVFLMVRVLPGSPARMVGGSKASQEEIEKIRKEYGLDQPLYVQYGMYLRDLITLDLGTSIKSGLPVSQEVGARLPYTLLLISMSLGIASFIGIPLGILSATHHQTILDYGTTSLALFGISMPIYWSGLMLMYLFAGMLRLLPAGGADSPLHFILPSCTLAFALLANIVRLTRSSMLEILNKDYIRTARSKGIKERTVIYVHALRNAIKPVITIIGLQFGTLLGGTVLTESVFAWPGIGQFIVKSIFSRDYIVIQSLILVFALIIVVTNLLTDLSYGAIDPRIKYK